MDSDIVQPDVTQAHRQAAEAVLAALGTDARSGLSQREARERLEQQGKNELAAAKAIPAWRKFLAQFTNFLVVLLLVAAAISAGLWFYERDSALPYEGIAILAIVLLNAGMGYVQESRAEQALAALRRMSAAHATVIGTAPGRAFPRPRSCRATSFSSTKATPFLPMRG